MSLINKAWNMKRNGVWYHCRVISQITPDNGQPLSYRVRVTSPGGACHTVMTLDEIKKHLPELEN
jgi:hypothetical protein